MNLGILLARPSALRVIEFLELEIKPPGSVIPWTVLSHDMSLFLWVVTEVKALECLCPLEDSVTVNLLVHVF
jgi:hypothetical protein